MINLQNVVRYRRFTDTFNVQQRAETVSTTTGRSSTTTTTVSGVSGVVTPASPKQLERLPEEQRMRKSLSIVTTFALQGPSPNRQADVIVWPASNGNSYVVVDVGDWGRFGFVEVIAQMIDLTPNSPVIQEQ